MSFLEEAWEEREEVKYPQLFGATGEGIYPLTEGIFERLNASAVDPRWLTFGVFKCSPTNERESWVYVSSGMSNPWESEVPKEFSGMGIEFLIETDEEATWPIEVLRTLIAYNLLLSAGQMGDFPTLDYGHRVPLPLSSDITTMMFAYPSDFPDHFEIKSGRVDLIQVVGINQAELEFAKQSSSQELSDKLLKEFGNLRTQKVRKSVV